MRAILPICVITLMCVAFASNALSAPAAKDKPPVPDLTKGGSKDTMHDWTLGPTGARGWLWAWKGQTTDARQILITEVASGSPSDGILKPGDVVVGVNGKPFSDDARIAFAKAITEAEAKAGALDLIRWRGNETKAVQVKLPALGAYADTAPYGCAKSSRIFEEGCAAIAKKGFTNPSGRIVISIPNDLKALSLLASGNKDYLPQVSDYAKAVAASTPSGLLCWGYGYETVFLAEYAYATKDTSVMPGLLRLSTDIAKGQSAVGTWGHIFARPEGNLNGYGCMNQPGIVLTLAMQVAREAGVRSPDVDRAIAKSARFLRWYVDKGAIPYGDHPPWPGHDDNGKCSSAALMFDLLGDKPAASFFSRMSTAAYAERESGHTGNFFNLLWALPGVSRSGPLATSAYFKETAWYYDLARSWDGSFRHQGIPGDVEQYEGWDSTGAYLLGYALPLKSLIVTGRKPTVVTPLTAPEVADTIASGRWNWWNAQEIFYDRLPTPELIHGLSSWSPAVRLRSAKALATKPDASIPDLIGLLDARDKETRYGATAALRYFGPKADASSSRMRALLASPDPWQRVLAAQTIVELSDPFRKAAIPDLLRSVIRKDDPADPRRCVMGTLTEVLFKPGPGTRDPDSILRTSLDAVEPSNRPLLINAIRDVLHGEDGRIRGGVSRIYSLLTAAELASLMPDIVEAIRRPAPSGEMFAYEIRLSGLELLADLHIREGQQYCADLMETLAWGRDKVLPRCISILSSYGGNARPLLPQLRAYRTALAAEIKRPAKGDPKDRNLIALDQVISLIEADQAPIRLRSLADFITNPRR